MSMAYTRDRYCHLYSDGASLDLIPTNLDKSAASLCRNVAARFPDVYCNFYLLKNPKIDNNLATTEAREKKPHICNT